MTTTADPAAGSSPTSSFREQGNEEYRKGNYLKAAANYTKAIKEEPDEAALYSNRSAALTQINKLPKALADAEECIRLDPEWDKGYFRKGAVLEAQGKLNEVS
jgi:tetratricopeptide (TPR) repeat protein